MKDAVSIQRHDDIIVLVIDNPPINAGSAAVRRGLMDGIGLLKGDDALTAAVIIGAGDTFIAGSDLKEFGQPLEHPQLPAVIAAIEDCGKPVVAALDGAALGGGFELALGCDARVATPRVVVGLPEVTLGIIPGAGGTQRLPRIVGVPQAIRMICAGERVSGEAAHAAGLVDAIVPGDLLAGAISHARGLAGRKSIVRELTVANVDEAEVEAAARDALRAGKNRPAVVAAIEAVKSAATLPVDEALTRDRAAFESLRLSREALALRYQFFAERDAARHPRLKGIPTRPVTRIAVIGAGTMGSGIAIAALEGGYQVLLLEQDQAALERGSARITEYYGSRVSAGKLDGSRADASLARLERSIDWDRVATADLVIEAVYEELAVKQDVFRRLDRLARPGAILATNTSYLDLDAIANATSRPQDVVGLHFFSPAHVMKLLEVVSGATTAADVLATALEVGKRLRKTSVLAGNAFGFIGNRMYSAYRKQCEFMIEEGAYPDQVDAALEAFGFAMGPFAVADLSGLDIAWRMRQNTAANRDPAHRYVRIPDMLCEAGRLGRKTGGGYYAYDADGRRKLDPEVRRLIDEASAAKGVARRQLDDDEIRRRAVLAMMNEAALLLAEGIAQRPGDVDVVLTNGYGFPRWEGGVAFRAREQGEEVLAKDLDWLADLSGPGFVRGDVRVLLD